MKSRRITLHLIALDSSTWYRSEGDTSRKGHLKKTHQWRTSTKVEASNQEVSKTRRSIIYHLSGETTNLEEEQIKKGPTSSTKLPSKSLHQASPLGEGNLKNIKILGRQAIKSSRRKQIHYISKSIK